MPKMSALPQVSALQRLSLRSRLMIFLGLFLLLLMLAVALMGARRDRDLLSRQLEEEGMALARAYALSAENALILRGAGLSRVAGEAGRVPGVAFLVIVGADHRVLAHSEPSRIGEESQDEAVLQAFQTPIGAVEAGRTPNVIQGKDRILRIIMPLVILDQVRGVMELGLHSDLVARATLASTRSAFLLALAAYLLGIGFVALFANSLARPLSELSRAAERMSAGDLGLPIPVSGGTEVSSLAASFERMRSELAASFEGIRVRAAEIERLKVFNENILNSFLAGVVTLDLGQTVRGMNHGAEALLGLRAAEVVGRPAAQVLAAWPDLAAAVDGILGSGALSLEVLVTDLAGEGRPARLLRILGSPYRDERGMVAGDVLVLEDISRVRAMENRVRDAEKMAAMGELAAGLAHEVRNPLGSIRNAAQFLGDKMGDTDPMARFPRLIVGEADRLNALVTRLLEYTRPETGGSRPTRLRETLEQAALLGELKVAGSRIRITRHYPEPGPLVQADPGRLLQAFVNLLFNAIEAIPGPGEIRVEAATEEGQAVVTVTDSGGGFPPDLGERIFEPFFSLKEGGTGLGLPIVRQILGEHGGRVNAANAPQGGAVFRAVLPLCPEEEAHA